ncbi:MAG: PleD family two-component system response regulator [Paracoccaceae bacterium]
MSGRILVVDDVATNRMVLQARLSAAYFDVLQAETGLEAIEVAMKKQPDLIILDVLMPGIDGFETCRRLKAAEKTEHVPVVMVTSLDRSDNRLRGLKCGADDFLSRPISDLALFSRVRNLLRSKFMLDELRLRDRTTLDFGLGEILDSRAKIVPPKARVALVPSCDERNWPWARTLEELTPYDIQICPDETAARALEGPDMPDAFVVHSRAGPLGDGLRLVSHLRSRPHSRHTSAILVVPPGDQEKASKGLDLGADDYLFEDSDPLELVARLNSQIRRKQLSDRLRENLADSLRLAVRDPLTGLYNRRYAKQHLSRITERARETGKGFALMLLDIDKFKAVNDTYGHAVGDQVLKDFSHRIRENLRGVDLVSRMGGEEFLVAMPDTTEAQARKASERLRKVIEKTVFAGVDGQARLHITVSIGVTIGDPEAPDVDKLLQEADGALYASKAEGRNTVTLVNSAA